jgi:hypothetical protein
MVAGRAMDTRTGGVLADADPWSSPMTVGSASPMALATSRARVGSVSVTVMSISAVPGGTSVCTWAARDSAEVVRPSASTTGCSTRGPAASSA